MIDLNWLDITLAVVLIYFALYGLIKGLVISFFECAGFIAAIFIARYLSIYFTQYIIVNTQLYKNLNDYCLLKFNKSLVYPALNIFFEPQIIEQTLAHSIVSLISFGILFLIVRLLISIIANVLNIFTRLPVLRQFNRIGGFVLGILKGIFILCIFFAIITPIMPILQNQQTFIRVLNSSKFAPYFYKYNFILLWLKDIL